MGTRWTTKLHKKGKSGSHRQKRRSTTGARLARSRTVRTLACPLSDAADSPVIDGHTPLSMPIEKITVCSAVWGTGIMRLVTTRRNACRHRRPVDDGTALLHACRRAQASLSRVNTSCRLPLQLLPTSRALPFTFTITSKHHADVFAKVTPAAHFVMWTSCRWLSIWKASVHRQ